MRADALTRFGFAGHLVYSGVCVLIGFAALYIQWGQADPWLLLLGFGLHFTLLVLIARVILRFRAAQHTGDASVLDQQEVEDDLMLARLVFRRRIIQVMAFIAAVLTAVESLVFLVLGPMLVISGYGAEDWVDLGFGIFFSVGALLGTMALVFLINFLLQFSNYVRRRRARS